MTSKPKSELALAQAKAKGQVETVARGPSSASSIAASKLDDNEATDFKQEKVITLEFKLALQKARQAKGLSQADLAKLINVTGKVIQDYEVSVNDIALSCTRIRSNAPQCPPSLRWPYRELSATFSNLLT
jgi:ribosome-binding protein aMBF1 (putative translation factor)